MDERIQQVFTGNERCQKIAAVEGVGPVTATAIVAAVADAKVFRNGRQLAAWLGLVPRQHSSGDKQRLLAFGVARCRRGQTVVSQGAEPSVPSAASCR